MADGLTRVQSSLELLSYTASLKNEIETAEEEDYHPARVSPAAYSLPSPQNGRMTSENHSTHQDFSIEGYPSTDQLSTQSDLSPIPSILARDTKRSAFEARVMPLASTTSSNPGSAPSLPSLLFRRAEYPSSSSLLVRHMSNENQSSQEPSASPFAWARQPDIFAAGSSSSLLTGSFSSESKEPPAAFDLTRENTELRKQLAVKDQVIEDLQKKVAALEKHVQDLRQLPTGKISQIPAEYVFPAFVLVVSTHLLTSLSPLRLYSETCSRL